MSEGQYKIFYKKPDTLSLSKKMTFGDLVDEIGWDAALDYVVEENKCYIIQSYAISLKKIGGRLGVYKGYNLKYLLDMPCN